MNQKDYIKNIYSFIREISDQEFQERVWVLGQGPEVSSYIEVICGLYDDFKFDLFLKEFKNYNLSLQLYFYLNKLDIKLKSYKAKETDSEILKDKEWHNVVLCAKEAIAAFDEEIFNLREKISVYYNQFGFENDQQPQLLLFGQFTLFEHLATLIRFLINEGIEGELDLLKNLFDESKNCIFFYHSNENYLKIELNCFFISANTEKWQSVIDTILPLTKNKGIVKLDFDSNIQLICQSIT